jgi:hypothetical protein
MDTKEEDKGCVNVIRCDGLVDTAEGWKTPNASWLDMEEADEGR